MSEEREKKDTVLYEEIEQTINISQGDIIYNFPIFVQDTESLDVLESVDVETLKQNLKFKLQYTNIIILSQSCDLVLDKARNRTPVDPVIVAAILDIGHYSKDLVLQANSNSKPGYFLLNKDDKLLNKSFIIDFGKIYTIPYSILSKYSASYGSRIRPISPILEKISQHFGNYFSRIGTEYERDKTDLKEEHTPLRQEYEKKVEIMKQEEFRRKQQQKQK